MNTSSVDGTLSLLRLRGCRVAFIPRADPYEPGICPGRGKIREFSDASRDRMCEYLYSCRATYRVFITLTFPLCHPSGHRADIAKGCLRAFGERLFRLQGHRDGWSAFWFLEFQKNGTVHFHIYNTHYVSRFWLSRAWYECCGSYSLPHLRAGTNVKRLPGRSHQPAYAAKYSAKRYQKVVPDGFGLPGRFWGVRGLRSTVEADVRPLSASSHHKVVRVRQELEHMERDGRAKRSEFVTDMGETVILFHVEQYQDRVVIYNLMTEVPALGNQVLRQATTDRTAEIYRTRSQTYSGVCSAVNGAQSVGTRRNSCRRLRCGGPAL